MTEDICKKIMNHQCRKCGSRNYTYVHNFDPVELKTELYFECYDCGDVEYL